IYKLTGINHDRIDGGAFDDTNDFSLTDVVSDDNINEIDGLLLEKDNPEELVAPSITDTITINVIKEHDDYVPRQSYYEIDGGGRFSHSFSFSENADKVFVYADGKRVSE